MNDSAHIELRSVEMTYPGTPPVAALRDISFSIGNGEFVCCLGPSGCGKSTLLYVVAGFLFPTGGEILLNGRRLDGPGPTRGFVFQKHALFPWLTAEGNVAFGLKMQGVPNLERKTRAQQMLARVGLDPLFADKYPGQLSGGMEQRVGLARVLAIDPPVLLMDEPFGSIDAQVRLDMQALLLRLWEATRKTVLFVTHDIDEAIILADRIIVLSARPGTIKAEITVDLPRPRHYEMTISPKFLSLKKSIFDLIQRGASGG